ncbi:MAG: helix-turn-helix transcriptional regulator [Xanthobacteraceae bacterium]
MTDFYGAVGPRLRQARVGLGITEQQAADVFGVTLRTYRKYEAGGRQRSAKPVVRFADKYNVSPDWIFMGQQPMMDAVYVGRISSGRLNAPTDADRT